MKVIFVFAHPDDESFSSGGTIAKLVKEKHIVRLITATKGEAGQRGDPLIKPDEPIGKVREEELKKAAKILGISEICFLGFIDGTLKDKEKGLEKKISEIIKKENPDIVITHDKRGGSNHPDHKAVSRCTTNVFNRYKDTVKKHVHLYHTANPRSNVNKIEKLGFAYTAFGKVRGVPDEDITTVVHIEKTFEIKIKALMAHKTQEKDWQRFLKVVNLLGNKKEYFQLISENKIL